MKTLTEIDKEIKKLLESYRFAISIAEKSQIKNNISNLRAVELYLKTEPREEFIRSERERLQTEIKILENRFKEWQQSRPCSTFREYENYMHIPGKRAQLRQLKYILD